MNNNFSLVQDKYQMADFFIGEMLKLHKELDLTYEWIYTSYFGLNSGGYTETQIISALTDDFSDLEYPRVVYSNVDEQLEKDSESFIIDSCSLGELSDT